jgi:hypothetical protein
VFEEEFQKILEEARQKNQKRLTQLSGCEAMAEALHPIWEQLNALNPSNDEY